MVLSVADAFKKFISQLTPSAADRTKAALHRASINQKLQTTYGLNEFFESGSFLHGTGVRHFSDVDVFAVLQSTQPFRSESILTSMRTALKERFPSTIVHVSRPAVVLEFGGGYERVEIVPAYADSIDGTLTRYEIPGVTSDWMYSSPKAHLAYVTAANTREAVEGGVKGLTRLLKAWKYYRQVPVSSFYLEMRAAEYMKSEYSVVYPLDVKRILRRLEDAKMAPMRDPTGRTGLIQPCSSGAKREDAMTKLSRAARRAERAVAAEQDGRFGDAFEAWDKLFAGHFPSYG